VLVPAGEEEAPEEILRVGPLQAGRALRRLEHRAALVQLDLVLREVRGLDAMAEPHGPGDRRPPAEQRLEQGRFPGSVRPDQADVLPALEREGRVGEQRLVAGPDHEVARLDHGSPAARGLEELEAKRTAA